VFGPQGSDLGRPSGHSLTAPRTVFERFYRGTPAGSGDTAPRTAGSGLGLAIVQTIAEAHGGTATVTSRPGKGARFKITLPLG
jgi:two-component system, OmpR family, sensor kinase